jgi:hypothetical protein
MRPILTLVFTAALAAATLLAAEASAETRDELVRHYGSKLHYLSDVARQRVKQHALDCGIDGRTVALETLLLLRIAQTIAWGGPPTVVEVDAKGDVVRGYEAPGAPPQLLFDLNAWNEASLPGFSAAAISNVCAGGFGPVYEGGHEAATPPRVGPKTSLSPSRVMLVSNPRDFNVRAKADPVWACAYKTAVSRQRPGTSVVEHCAALTPEQRAAAEQRASRMLSGDER